MGFERVDDGEEEANEQRMRVVCLVAKLKREVGLSCWCWEGRGERMRDEIEEREADVVAIVVQYLRIWASQGLVSQLVYPFTSS